MTDIDCLIVNGDSYSARLSDHPGYAELLALELKVPLYNLAVAGSSNDRILRSTVQNFNCLKQRYKRPMVIIGWSFLHRIEVWYHGSNHKVISRAPDQFNEKTQLRFCTLDWIPDNEIDKETKDYLTSVHTIDKKIINWYLNLYFLSNLFSNCKTPYLFFSAADNTDFPIDSWPILRLFSFVQTVKADPRIYRLHDFCIQQWAKSNDKSCAPQTGHLSEQGHKKFSEFMLQVLNDIQPHS